MGYRLLQKIAEELSEVSIVEFAAKQEGRNMTMVLGPAKKTGSAKKAAPKAAVKEKIVLAEKSTGGK
jgi:translation initiation factor IF-3